MADRNTSQVIIVIIVYYKLDLLYLEVCMGVPAMQAGGLRWVTTLLWWGPETWAWQSLDTQRSPTLIWTESPWKLQSVGISQTLFIYLSNYTNIWYAWETHSPPGGSGYVGTRGVVPSAGLEVTVSGVSVTRRVSFPPTCRSVKGLDR